MQWKRLTSGGKLSARPTVVYNLWWNCEWKRAYEIYKKLYLWEDAIQCLIISDRKVDAKELVNEQLKINPTPILWCLLGDLESDVKYYIKSWELSGGKCARAQRSLGHYYYKNNDYDKAIDSFEKANNINPMNESSQFLLGCCYLKNNNLKSSITTFSRVVSLNPESSDAWANMATAHFNLKNINEAKICIEQSIKYNQLKWQLWDILLRISVTCRDVQCVCKCIGKLLELGKKANIESWMVAFIIDCGINNGNDKINSMIDDTLKSVTREITDSSEIWNLCAKYKSFNKDYESALEFVFKEYRCIEVEIIKNLEIKNDNMELQCEHDKVQMKCLLNCLSSMVMLLKRLTYKSRHERKVVVIDMLKSVKSRIIARTNEINVEFNKEIDNLIENADVEDVICIEADGS